MNYSAGQELKDKLIELKFQDIPIINYCFDLDHAEAQT